VHRHAQAKTYQDCESQFPEAGKLFYPPEQRQQFREQIQMGIIPKVDIEPVVL
jgi:hypothetical protein